MRILVAGPFPPAPDQAAADVLRLVERLIGAGHEVEVLSPVPSAAEHSGPLAGFKGAIALARWSRRFDALHLQVSRSMLFRPGVPQVRRVIDSLILGAALRLWGHTTADLGDLSDVPGGGGGLSGRVIWACIDEILVDRESVRNHAVKVLHAPAGRVKVNEAAASPQASRLGRPASSAPGPAARLPWRIQVPAAWEDVMSQVRERAALERSRLDADTKSPGPGDPAD
ncbi:MAG: hypothetical protein NVSMB32_08280 [Actinomycetota bacterium]